jgi:hypothetical protein
VTRPRFAQSIFRNSNLLDLRGKIWHPKHFPLMCNFSRNVYFYMVKRWLSILLHTVVTIFGTLLLQKDTFGFTFGNWYLMHFVFFLTFRYKHHLKQQQRLLEAITSSIWAFSSPGMKFLKLLSVSHFDTLQSRHCHQLLYIKAIEGQTSEYAVPRGCIFLGKSRTTLVGSSDGKMNV